MLHNLEARYHTKPCFLKLQLSRNTKSQNHLQVTVQANCDPADICVKFQMADAVPDGYFKLVCEPTALVCLCVVSPFVSYRIIMDIESAHVFCLKERVNYFPFTITSLHKCERSLRDNHWATWRTFRIWLTGDIWEVEPEQRDAEVNIQEEMQWITPPLDTNTLQDEYTQTQWWQQVGLLLELLMWNIYISLMTPVYSIKASY